MTQLRHARMARRAARRSLVGCSSGLLVTASLVWPGAALAESAPAALAADPDQLPTREELNQDPAATGLLLFELLEQAERAEKSKDYTTAARYYRALGEVVPERATAFSKLCEMYQALGERENALGACRQATGLPGAKVTDYLRQGALILSKPAPLPLTDAEVKEVRFMLGHLRREGIESSEADVLECQLAVAMEDAGAMKECVQRLEHELPGHPFTLTYQMSLALLESDFARARAIIVEARRIPMPPESIALMEAEVAAREDAGATARATPQVSPRRVWSTLLGSLAASAFALGLVAWARRRRPKTI